MQFKLTAYLYDQVEDVTDTTNAGVNCKGHFPCLNVTDSLTVIWGCGAGVFLMKHGLIKVSENVEFAAFV